MSKDDDDNDAVLSMNSSVTAVKRLLPLAERSRAYLPIAFLLLGVMATVQLIIPQIMRLAIDGPLTITNMANKEARLDELYTLGILCAKFLVIGFFANYLSTWFLQKFGQKLVLNLRQMLFRKMHRLPISYFDKHAVGRTVTRVVNDSNSLSELFTGVLAAGLGDVLLLSGILVVLILTDPILSAILALFCPLLIALVLWFRKHSSPLYKTQRTLLARLNAFFSETLEGLPTVKSFQAEDFQRGQFAKLNDECLDNELKLLTLVARFRPGFAVARIAATGLLLTVGGLSILAGYSSLGTLVSSLLYIRLLFSPLEQLAERYNILIRATVASERVLAILDLPEEPGREGKEPDPETRITFDNVHYHYQADKPVLKGISFSLEPGQTLALVGPTGCGKSTIISLLLGYYPLLKSEGHKGQILIGQDQLQDVQVNKWRQRLAFVSQDLFLFKGPLSQNVGLYKSFSNDEIKEALDKAACLDFVEKLPEGLDTIVGEKGHALSTGQRQLLSFARALAFDPDLLFLDEATANIDSETEAQVEKALDSLLEGRQAIIVAHRLSTVKRADRILVLSEGQVAEQGSHDELMAQDGLYAKMVKKSES